MTDPTPAARRSRDEQVRACYDTVADAYLAELGDELTHKPFDAWLLTRVRQEVGAGPVLDAGCGPGHVSEFLARDGADVTGLDLSPAMVALAERTHPALRFLAGSMLEPPAPAGAPGWAAITCWYGMVHLTPEELDPVLAGFAHAVVPGGRVAIGLHAGDRVDHHTELLGREVDVDFVFHDPPAVLAAAIRAGLRVDEWYLRGPGPTEHPSDRLYLLASRVR